MYQQTPDDTDSDKQFVELRLFNNSLVIKSVMNENNAIILYNVITFCNRSPKIYIWAKIINWHVCEEQINTLIIRSLLVLFKLRFYISQYGLSL